MRIAVFTDAPGWHGKRLRAAFAALGADARLVALDACHFDLDRGVRGLAIPGFARALPDAALVRAVCAGTFEQVTLRLGVLHALARLGIPVVNDPRAIERCVDKSMTSWLLRERDVPTPATWVTESAAEARRIAMRETAAGRMLVLKPLFGSQGKGLARIGAGDALPAPETVGGVYYLQRYVAPLGGRHHDFRVFVIEGVPVASMERRGRTWITNVAQGAEAVRTLPDVGRDALACTAARSVGADYAGVDLIRDADGRWQVLEVNSMPAWRGLEQASGIDIAALLARLVLGRVAAATARECAP
jgi:RimK family alpha-L-glutamate ligase